MGITKCCGGLVGCDACVVVTIEQHGAAFPQQPPRQHGVREHLWRTVASINYNVNNVQAGGARWGVGIGRHEGRKVAACNEGQRE